MKTSIKYNDTSELVNIVNAIHDSIEYLGNDKWKSLIYFIRCGQTIRDCIQRANVGCMLSGIEGFPVKAIKYYALRISPRL